MNSSHSVRKIASNYLWTPTGYLSKPLVEVDASGLILNVSSYDNIDRCEGVEFYAGVLTPGFVNCHCHLELSHLRGAIKQGLGHTSFVGSVGKLRNSYSEQQRLDSIDYADTKMWSDGIQAVGDIANGAASFNTKSQSKITYHTFVEAFGLRGIDHSQFDALLKFPHSSLTPHSVYSIQDADFKMIAASGTSPLSIHFMESDDELSLFSGKGNLWNWYQNEGFKPDFLHYATPARRIVESVPHDRSVILVHNCHVEAVDIELIMNHFTAPVWWCLCPRSNHYISNSPPPYNLLRAHNLNICLGTDSLASNGSLSIFEEMQSFEGLSLSELLLWATFNGAAALGFADCGIVESGSRGGLLLLSALDYTTMSLTANSTVRRII